MKTAQDIIGPPVGSIEIKSHLLRVFEIPAGVSERFIYEDTGEGFRLAGHRVL
jgi:hypothetical protein